MEPELDLNTASRETLLAIIAEQQELIRQLQRRLAELEARLKGGSPQGMPGNKPGTTRRKERKEGRKPRPHGFARLRMEPTQRVEHAVASCPDCAPS